MQPHANTAFTLTQSTTIHAHTHSPTRLPPHAAIYSAEKSVSEYKDRKCTHTPPNHPHPPYPHAAIYSAEKSVSEYKDRLSQAVVDDINAAIAELRGVLESDNAEVRAPGACSQLADRCCLRSCVVVCARVCQAQPTMK